MVTAPAFNVIASTNPAKAEDFIVLWLNSMGPVSGNFAAGQASAGAALGSQPLKLATPPAVRTNRQVAEVLFSDLRPGLTGLYRINVQAPSIGLTRTLSSQATAGFVSAKTSGYSVSPGLSITWYR